MYPALLFDALPWWLAAPLLQIGVLVVGMALDETYVNRTTVLAGSLALAVHVLVAGEVGLLVGVYLDLGLVIGAYGLYTYVVDAYVDTWFRIAAYFVYSPIAIMLVIFLPDLFAPLALVIAGYANLQLMAYFAPTEPYYFGPESPEAFAEAVVETETGEPEGEQTADVDGRAGGSADAAGTDGLDPEAGGNGHEAPRPGAEPAAAGGESTERGILPEFMRRL